MLLPDGVECVFNVGPSELIALPLGLTGKTQWPQIKALHKFILSLFESITFLQEGVNSLV